MRHRCVRSAAATAGALLLAGLLSPRLAWAEDLLQVFELARAHDAGLQAAQTLLRSAEPRAAQARAGLLPHVSATASSGWSRSDPSATDLDPAGARTDTRSTSGTLTVRQPLFNQVASTDVALAQVSLDAARATYDSTLQEFILKVAQAYFDVLSAQDLLATRRASRASIAGQLDAASRAFAAGTAIVTDRQDAQARHDLALSEEVAAENELRVRRLALDRLTGRRAVSPAGLAAPSAVQALAPGELDAWLRQSEAQPAVRSARLAVEAARLDTRRARASTLPTVDAVGSVGANRLSGSAVSSSLQAGRTTTATVGIELSVPIFAGFARQNRIAETLLLEDRAAQQLEATLRGTAEATERAYYELVSGQAQVNALEAAVASSEASLEGTQLGYRAGVRLNLDVLNAHALLFQARSDLAKARYEVLMRHLKLQAAAGQLRPESLAEINRLLAS